MAANNPRSNAMLQDGFLNVVRKENTQVTIHLLTGYSLKGYIRAFDAFTVLLDVPGKPSQLVFKHAISNILPSKFVEVFKNDGKTEQ